MHAYLVMMPSRDVVEQVYNLQGSLEMGKLTCLLPPTIEAGADAILTTVKVVNDAKRRSANTTL